MTKLEGCCLLMLWLWVLPMQSSGQLTHIQEITVKNGEDLKFQCPGNWLLHVVDVVITHNNANEVCEIGTLVTRDQLEGRGKGDFEEEEHVKSMEDLMFDIQRLCYHQGDFNVHYMCIPLPRAVAKVINPTHSFRTHTQSIDNHTAYLHSSQFTRSPHSLGFECKIKNQRSQAAIVTVYDMHASNPDALYPIYCIKNGRDRCYRSRLEMLSFTLNVGELLRVTSLDDSYDLTYFIGIKAYEGATLYCVPNLEVLTEDEILKNSKDIHSGESHTATTTIAGGGGARIHHHKTDDDYQDPKWQHATIALCIVVVFVLLLLALIKVYGVRGIRDDGTGNNYGRC